MVEGRNINERLEDKCMTKKSLDSKIVLIGAMKQEIDAYTGKFKKECKSGKLFIGLTGVGKPAAAAYTQKIISELKPSYLIFTGVG